MSDLVATNCGCEREGNGCCNTIIWLILLSCLCNGNSGSVFGGDGCGCGDNNCLWIILLLLSCGNGCGGIF